MTQSSINQTSPSDYSATRSSVNNNSQSSQQKQHQSDFQKSLKQASKSKVEQQPSDAKSTEDAELEQDNSEESRDDYVQASSNLNVELNPFRRIYDKLGDGASVSALQLDQVAMSGRPESDHSHAPAPTNSTVFDQWVKQTQSVADSAGTKNSGEQSWQLSLSDSRAPMSSVVFQTNATGQLNMHMNSRPFAQTQLLDRKLQRLRDRLTDSGVNVGELSVQGADDHHKHTK
jgi:hypothetical protein